MRVEITTPNGSVWHEGRSWVAGEVVDLPEGKARRLIKAAMARRAGADRDPKLPELTPLPNVGGAQGESEGAGEDPGKKPADDGEGE